MHFDQAVSPLPAEKLLSRRITDRTVLRGLMFPQPLGDNMIRLDYLHAQAGESHTYE